jgi:ATP-dependent RNA helicase DDX49/DBP8
MLPRSKRRPLTTDDLMRRQELGPHKRQKRVRDKEEEESLPGSDGPTSGGESQSEELSTSGGDEDNNGAMSDVRVQDGEGNVPSRFSFKPHQSTVTMEDTAPSHLSSLPHTFMELGVPSSLVAAMNKMSIHTPTEVQIACIPPILNGMCFSFSTPSPPSC